MSHVHCKYLTYNEIEKRLAIKIKETNISVKKYNLFNLYSKTCEHGIARHLKITFKTGLRLAEYNLVLLYNIISVYIT